MLKSMSANAVKTIVFSLLFGAFTLGVVGCGASPEGEGNLGEREEVEQEGATREEGLGQREEVEREASAREEESGEREETENAEKDD